VPDRHDKPFAHDQVRLPVLDLLAHELSGPQRDKEYVVVDIQLGTLMRLAGVLDHQFMKTELRLDRAKQRRVWLVQTQPNDPPSPPAREPISSTATSRTRWPSR
jgi:hypothetical protein